MPVPEDFRRNVAAAIKRSVEPVAERIELYEAGTEIVPGLTTLSASGHTPGMANFLVQSGNDQVLLTADLAYHPVVNVDQPWIPGPDRDKDTALASRRRVFDMAAADRLLVLGFHIRSQAWTHAQYQRRLRLGSCELAAFEPGPALAAEAVLIDQTTASR